VTRSQHFHETTGGIYFWEQQIRRSGRRSDENDPCPAKLPIPEWPTGFLAFLEPLGARDGFGSGPSLQMPRSQAVRVTQIVAHPFSTLYLPRTTYREGALIPLVPGDDLLYPVPLTQGARKDVRFTFHTLDDGRIYFSPVNRARQRE
jgi:hypothetical protein